MGNEKLHYVLEAKDLTIGYQTKRAKHTVASDINIRLNQGQLVGLIGANGIGKSTLLRTLTNVQDVIKGQVFIDQKSLSSYNYLELAKALSIVLTESISVKHLTVSELVALGRQPYTNWVGTLSEMDKTIVLNALKLTNTESLKHKYCHELSDGQLQNVMIARALAQDTNLIVLDEPTTHLDMHNKAYILKLLQQLTRGTQKTILFSSHEIDLCIQLCDQIIAMFDEKVICDTPKNLIQKGVFSKLFPNSLIVFDEESQSFKINPMD